MIFESDFLNKKTFQNDKVFINLEKGKAKDYVTCHNK